uniref:60S ribosomal protein L21-like n=1 Tax=Arvicanthis niloticus TaxID=61156 RepID=UPI001486180D|nr:60S ribosomal protein L21-like [Arvicanthis niloticus]
MPRPWMGICLLLRHSQLSKHQQQPLRSKSESLRSPALLTLCMKWPTILDPITSFPGAMSAARRLHQPGSLSLCNQLTGISSPVTSHCSHSTLQASCAHINCQNEEPKGKEERHSYVFSRTFEKHGVVPLDTNMRIYKKGDTVDIKGMGTVHKGMPHKCYHGKTSRVYDVTQYAVGITVNKQVKGEILSKTINVRIEYIKPSKSRESFRKRVKENNQKKKEAKEKGTWVQLKRQPAPPREAHFLRTNGKEPELLEPISYEFMAQCTKEKYRTRLQSFSLGGKKNEKRKVPVVVLNPN